MKLEMGWVSVVLEGFSRGIIDREVRIGGRRQFVRGR